MKSRGIIASIIFHRIGTTLLILTRYSDNSSSNNTKILPII
jgi:hypothetical protein